MKRDYDNLPEPELVRALAARDEGAFVYLLDRYAASMRRVALAFVPSVAVAEEVVQETWLEVVRRVGRFEGRSSLKTWVFRILTNRARTRGERENRTRPFSAFGEGDEGDPGLDPDRFQAGGGWLRPPGHWSLQAEDRRLMNAEAIAALQRSLEDLPPAQRAVVVMRDVEGLSSEDICSVLGITETHQRVLLHRARTRLRAILESFVERS